MADERVGIGPQCFAWLPTQLPEPSSFTVSRVPPSQRPRHVLSCASKPIRHNWRGPASRHSATWMSTLMSRLSWLCAPNNPGLPPHSCQLITVLASACPFSPPGWGLWSWSSFFSYSLLTSIRSSPRLHLHRLSLLSYSTPMPYSPPSSLTCQTRSPCCHHLPRLPPDLRSILFNRVPSAWIRHRLQLCLPSASAPTREMGVPGPQTVSSGPSGATTSWEQTPHLWCCLEWKLDPCWDQQNSTSVLRPTRSCHRLCTHSPKFPRTSWPSSLVNLELPG